MYLQITNIFDYQEAGLTASVFTKVSEAEQDAADYSKWYSHTLEDNGITIKRCNYLAGQTTRSEMLEHQRQESTFCAA